MKIRSGFMIILFFFLPFLPVQGGAGNEHPMEDHSLIKLIVSKGYGTTLMDAAWNETGRVVFWGRKTGAGTPETIHPVLYDIKTGQFTDLIPGQEMAKLIPGDETERVIEIAADRTANRIALNYVRDMEDRHEFATVLFVYDVKEKRVILRSTEPNYHTHMAMSPDGRRLAFCSHPTDWFNDGMNYRKPCGQIEVMDIATAKVSRAADPVQGGRSIVDSLYWSPDSTFLVFAYHSGTEKNRRSVLVKWDAERNKRWEFPLEGKREFVSGLKPLPDQRVLVFASNEIFRLDKNFKFDKTLHTGSALNSFVTSGTLLRFNDRGNQPGPGFGSPREIRID